MADPRPVTRPIIVDLGKTRPRRIRRLKRGRGRLAEEVREVVDEVRQEFGGDADGKEFVPVVVIYRKRRKRNKAVFPIPLPFK